MQYPDSLVRGRLVRRYKRFLSDIEIPGPDGTVQVTAHCANPGSMLGLAEPGSTVWLLPNRNPTAKLDWRWELTESDGDFVCINTSRANTIVGEALNAGEVPALSAYSTVRPEVKYGKSSRIDFLLEEDNLPPAYVEVKSVTLRRPEGDDPQAAEFPDSVTKRGAKHLDELIEVGKTGARAIMFFLVQRGDCTHFRAAADIDPVYSAALKRAVAEGVEVLCYKAQISIDGITLGPSLPLDLD
ncbi:DNA/RNA nuclease SfsA [Hwanghaeella grinnelliae]|uniref:Sugar fermentation stimulation protein homolog n=1 Tax=Hwanghaeella grinnelliae TaxID=2500179 RepID=A0A3S2WAN9_9PROT|nr:DNA/RNA nuclease SfsA [Hwanghaeella grinnelliae]RVU38053.1 DNA/RNA nuclease SfsA [Hwanghaeella grinnelliae]